MRFGQKTVMITGATSALGRAVAKAFAQLGARLVLVDADVQSLQADGHTSNATTRLAGINMLNQNHVTKCVAQAVQQFGSVDVLCNLATRYMPSEAVDQSTDMTWDYLFEINVGNVLRTARAVVPYMRREQYGKIINVAAFAAQQGSARMGPYAVAQSGVVRLTESMAAELQGHGINVNCVLPGVLDTRENRTALDDADFTHWVKTGALTDVILFLASDAARSVTGAALPVPGVWRA